MFVDYAVYFTISLLTISKFCDCWTTNMNITIDMETNPIGKILMQRFGVNNTTKIIFVLSIIIILVSAYPALNPNGYLLYQFGFIITGLITSIIQFAVALTNFNGEYNCITLLILNLHNKMDRFIASTR